MVTSSGAPSGACPLANRTVAVAAGRISRIATQSVSPVSPSKGRETNGAGSTCERRLVPWSVAPCLRRRDALPMAQTLVVPAGWAAYEPGGVLAWSVAAAAGGPAQGCPHRRPVTVLGDPPLVRQAAHDPQTTSRRRPDGSGRRT